MKIQKAQESLREAADLLCKAGNKKRCSFLVLVRTWDDPVNCELVIPANMIIIDSVRLQLENELSSLCDENWSNQGQRPGIISSKNGYPYINETN